MSTPFLPGYKPGTWIEIISAKEMLRSLQYDSGIPLTPQSLPYMPILGKQGKIVAILGMSGLLRVYFPHDSSHHIIQPGMISRTLPEPSLLSFDSLIANL